MKQKDVKASIQPKVSRSAIVTIMALAVMALVPIAVWSQSSKGDAVKQQSSNSNPEQELISLSKEKWRWMSERKIDSLDGLIQKGCLCSYGSNYDQASGTRGHQKRSD